MTRKVPSTSEKQLMLSQKILYYLRNLLVFSVGIDELERNQPVAILQRVIKNAYDPLVSAFMLADVASQTYILKDQTNVSLHKTGTNSETVELLKGIQESF